MWNYEAAHYIMRTRTISGLITCKICNTTDSGEPVQRSGRVQNYCEELVSRDSGAHTDSLDVVRTGPEPKLFTKSTTQYWHKIIHFGRKNYYPLPPKTDTFVGFREDLWQRPFSVFAHQIQNFLVFS